MPTSPEVEVAAREICKVRRFAFCDKHCVPDCKGEIKTLHENGSIEAAFRALSAVESFQWVEKRRTCRHPNSRGSSTISSDGSSKSDWYCPDCGMSGASETPPNPDRPVQVLQN